MTDPQGRKGQLEIIWQRSFRLLSLSSYLVFCWPVLRAKADSLTTRRGAAATLLFHLALWEHKCLCTPSTLINLMQLILPVVMSLWSDSKRPTDGRRCGGFSADFCGQQVLCGLEMEAQGRWGSWDMQTTLRQPVCKGMLVPLSFPSISTSLQGLHSTSDMKCGWWTFV